MNFLDTGCTIRLISQLVLFLGIIPAVACPQTPPPSAASPGDKPLPDSPTLMRAVEANQRKAETIEREYIYRQQNRLDERDSHGGVKKTEAHDFEVFWLDEVQVHRHLSKDGKPPTAEEQKKENERIDEVVKRARERRDKADAQGKETDSHGRDEITVARILELGSFSNPRREVVNGRPTIAVDYLGDQHAKTRNPGESALKELAGTVWIDEQDHFIQHTEGHFDHDFKVMGGLAVDVKKGTWFKLSFVKINDEVWLPQSIEGDGHARYLLFFSLSGHFVSHSSDYRKFKATSTILPGYTPVPDAPPPENDRRF